jgi:outer membrane protein OmpA-like peptidoglycan-associated protein
LPALSQVKVFRYIDKGFSIGTQLSLGSAKRYDSLDKKFFLQWGIDVKYSFANGYILKEKSWFDPYLLVGGGLNKWGDVKGSMNFGAGLNLWILKNFGVFIQTQYDYTPHAKVSPHANDPRPSFMHHSFGFVARFGKGKDSDKDGIPDAEDKCPNDPGKAELSGCPDTDGDGIIDKEDKCPTVAGIALLGGCPDSDGDGITDADDACPTQAGPASTKGCPDTDGDGIADKDDACPSLAGPAATKGCPDRDGDGIADKDDACPDQKGPATTKGCPDTDGDGIADKDDKCPTVAGLAEFGGCPKPALDETKKVEVQKKLSFAAKNIFFETGKDILKKESLRDLDSVVNIMKQYDFLKLNVDGHTDNVGTEKSNVDLSMKRASAVVDYLTKHGIAGDRLTAQGFGPNKPVADNKTVQGRAQNRRVELTIKD